MSAIQTRIVTGRSETVGAQISAHSDVAKISFTGDTAVGKSILRTESKPFSNRNRCLACCDDVSRRASPDIEKCDVMHFALNDPGRFALIRRFHRMPLEKAYFLAGLLVRFS